MTSRGSMKRSSESAKWSNHVEYTFVDLMYEEVLKGNIYTTSFSRMVWSDIRTKLFELTGTMLNIKQLKGKQSRLKGTWRKYHDLIHGKSGIGWNVNTNLLQAEPIIWEQLAKVNPDAAELRYKGFPHYVKLDVVFTGRVATGANARASTQRRITSRLRECSDTEGDSMDVGSSGSTTSTCNNIKTTVSGSGKRKAFENNIMVSLVETLNAAHKAIVDKAERKKSWSIERVIDVLNLFDDLEKVKFYLALRHFQDEGNRRTFMHLTPAQQRSYIYFNLST